MIVDSMPSNNNAYALTSSSLLYRVKQHDQGAWERMVSIYSPLVFYWCRHRSGLNPEDAADVMQEVFCSVASSIATFRKQKSGSFRSWLRTIAANKVRDLIRKKRGRADAIGGSNWNQQLLELPVSLSDEPEADETEAEEEGLVMSLALQLLADNFKENSRQAFWLVVVEDYTAAESAEELGMTEQAVWQACYRIRRRLGEELADLLD